MQSEFFSEDQNLAELITNMPQDDQRRFNKYGHLRVEAVFKDRLFILYKPTGLKPGGRHKEPEVLTTIRVTGFSVDLRAGCTVTLLDERVAQELAVGHIPNRLFKYPVYVCVPPRTILSWDARERDGRVWRSLKFGLLIKTRNRSNFYSRENVYMETPNDFQQLYPDVQSPLHEKTPYNY